MDEIQTLFFDILEQGLKGIEIVQSPFASSEYWVFFKRTQSHKKDATPVTTVTIIKLKVLSIEEKEDTDA